MVDGVGVCSVCARVCHKNHDISYAKYGNFFCDCGAKEDGSCLALNKRSGPQESSAITAATIMATSSAAVDATLRRRRASSPPGHQLQRDSTSKNSERTMHMAQMIDLSRDQLGSPEQWMTVVKSTLEFFDLLMPAVKDNCAKFSTVGCHLRAKNALERLHQPDKSFAISDQIMVATLGSQEGAFEHVRTNYAGEQAQTIRQLIATNMVRRVGLCCLSSPHGKRQHLAVSHEKGKVTILQLSALLKQADAAKKKLTLSRLASAPIPCTIMSLASNPANEDLLAVCGLKECHILTFSSSGSASEHIVITPQLETGNFIKRALWLPGSQTMLAIITCDYVKVYELSEDTYSPQYYFVVPSGKIRDCTFVYQSGTYYLLLFASSGYIYTQPLVEESLAKHGSFYVTNTLEISHPLVYETKGALGEGGASIYYSHLLQMLFFSYSIGRNFMAPLSDVNSGVKCVMLLQTGPTSTNSSKSSSTKVASQALMQWTEVAGHPGLIFAMQNQTNNPVVFMLKPDGILMQEIKYSNAKSKIMDMVAIRHTTGGQERTTLLLLCEDGSLRIFAANTEHTGYWLSPEVQPISNQLYQSYQPKAMRRAKKLGQRSNSGSGASATMPKTSVGSVSAANLNFPIDFFEHCNYLTEVEYAGNDLLQIYNTQQLKHRLNSTGLYVASTKAAGFTLEITHNEPNIVLTGVRVLIGTQDPARAPQSVTVHGRVVNMIASRPRWFDVPLTREETLLSEKKLSLTFGPSQDAENICMLDSIKVYGKTKEVFGWPEESDETSANGAAAATTAGPSIATTASPTTSVADASVQSITPLDKMITSMLEVLDCGLALLGGSTVDETVKKKAMDVATAMLLYPLPHIVQHQSKCVLATLLGNRTVYNAYKDREILTEVNTELERLKNIRDIHNIDPEAFFRLVVMTRCIAIARPQSLAKICEDQKFTIVPALMQLLQDLYVITPNYELQSSIVKIGLSHTEATVHCLVEIIYAFALSDSQSIDTMTRFFVQLLLDKSATISHSAKHAMIRLLRPRVKRRRTQTISSPPACGTPTAPCQPITVTPVQAPRNDMLSALRSVAAASVAAAAVDNPAGAAGGNDDYMDMQDIQEFARGAGFGNVEGAVGGYPQLVDLQQDADDEAIMEIAIALSLQDHEGDLHALQQGLADLQSIRGRAALQNLPVGAGTAAENYNV